MPSIRQSSVNPSPLLQKAIQDIDSSKPSFSSDNPGFQTISSIAGSLPQGSPVITQLNDAASNLKSNDPQKVAKGEDALNNAINNQSNELSADQRTGLQNALSSLTGEPSPAQMKATIDGMADGSTKTSLQNLMTAYESASNPKERAALAGNMMETAGLTMSGGGPSSTLTQAQADDIVKFANEATANAVGGAGTSDKNGMVAQAEQDVSQGNHPQKRTASDNNPGGTVG